MQTVFYSVCPGLGKAIRDRNQLSELPSATYSTKPNHPFSSYSCLPCAIFEILQGKDARELQMMALHYTILLHMLNRSTHTWSELGPHGKDSAIM